jgi:glutathione S-transferase
MKSDGSDITCYWASGSAPAWRVCICIKEKELNNANLVLIQFSKKEHKSPEVLAINPRGQAPTFKDGAVIINESYGVCQYLAETYANQGTALIPENNADKALNLQRLHEIENLYSKLVDLARFHWGRRPYYTDDITSEKKEELRVEINRWENYISKTYLINESFSLADVCFFPVIAFMFRLGITSETCPNLKLYYETCMKRESIKQTWPPHWKNSKGKAFLADV